MKEMLTFTFFGLVWMFVVFLMFASPVKPETPDRFWSKVGNMKYFTTFKNCHKLCLQANERGLVCKCQRKQNKFRPLVIK